MKLNKEQQKLAENGAMGHAVIRGIAGSGKTSVGVSRIPYLMDKYCIEKDKILFVTYNKSLIKYIEYLYQKIDRVENLSLFNTSIKRDNVFVKNIDSIINRYYSKYKKENQLDLQVIWDIPYDVMQEAIGMIKEKYPDAKIINNQNIKFLKDEINWIRGCRYTKLNLYQNADRIGRSIGNGEGPSKLHKNGLSREAIFRLMEEADKLLQKRGQIEGFKANLLALNYIRTHKSEESYKHIIIDEAQDLTKLQLDFISCLKQDSEDSSILFLMDVAQSIYPQAWLVKGRSFKSIGYDMTGKGFKLSKNYRTTTEISECAYSLLSKDMNIVTDDNFVKPSLLEKHGEYPIYRHFEDSREQNQYLVKLVRALVKQEYKLKDIAIVSKLNKNLELIQDMLMQEGIECLYFKNNLEEDFDTNKVKLLTMHSIKGLEFKVVILVDLNSNIIPYPQKGLELEDKADDETMERKLLYVGMTRAQEKLFMCSYGEASKFIRDIDNRFLNMQLGSRMNAYYNLPYHEYIFQDQIQDQTKEEESVRQWILNELITNYGYPKELIQVEYKVRNFSRDGKVDVAVMNSKTSSPYIFIEAKKKTVPIEEAIAQLKAYMNVAKATYGVATNGKSIAFLDSNYNRIKDIPVCSSNILPSSVETYKYIDKVTYTENVFQIDRSARELLVEEQPLSDADIQNIKVYSDIAAGIPIEIVDEISGNFSLPKAVLRGKQDLYILKVKGDSMIGAGIDNGDYVVLQKADTVQAHEIAAVYYNGCTTLKKIMRMGDTILLISENPAYEPIQISEGDFGVMGKLVGVIKNIM